MPVLQTLGKHEIRRELGRGAVGIVYEGWDPVIKRRVAVKTVRLADPPTEETAEELLRFRREAEAAGRLNHPNIVSVFDYGETDVLAYIVMEYVDGPTLKALLDSKEPFSLPRIVQLMEDLLAGLQFSHEHGVVHRDIKPANLMLTSSGQAKITDFGIARLETSSITQAGAVLGTPAYMAPEQFLGQAIDARSDIYSAGVLLYQLLTGERPFGGNMSSIMHKALNLQAPAPSMLSVTAPRRFDSVVQRAMAKRPEDRFASANDFAAAIREAAAVPPPRPAAELRNPDDDATIVAGARSKPAGRSLGSDPAAAGVARSPVAAIAKSSPLRRKTALPLTRPGLIGASVAGLAVLGGIGFFLLSGDRTPPGRSYEPAHESATQPASASPGDTRSPSVAAVTPAPDPNQAVALSNNASNPAANQPAGTAPPAEQPAPQTPMVSTPTVLPGPETTAAARPGTTMAPAPVAPIPIAPAPDAPAPVAPAPVAPAPVAPIPVAPAPVAPIPVAPAPVVPAPVVPIPVAPAPVAPAPVVPIPVMPANVAPIPVAPSPLEQARLSARSVPCSALGVTSEPNGLRISGFARAGPELDRLRTLARDAGRLAENVTDVDAIACVPIAAVAASVRTTLESNKRTFAVRPDRLEPIAGSRFAIDTDSNLPVLYVDLYQNNGMVRHVVRPGSAMNHLHVASVTASSPGPGLIVAIGTAKPLALGTRPEIEPAEEYLAVLRPQLDNAFPAAVADLAVITIRPAEPVVARPRPAEPSVTKTLPRPIEPAAVRAPPPRPPVLHSSRCSNIVSRAQLGETLSNAELTALRTECRS